MRVVVSMERTFGVAVARERDLVVAEDRHFECTREYFGAHTERIAPKRTVASQSFVVVVLGLESLVVRQLADIRVPFVHSKPVADIGVHLRFVKAMLDLLAAAEPAV